MEVSFWPAAAAKCQSLPLPSWGGWNGGGRPARKNQGNRIERRKAATTLCLGRTSPSGIEHFDKSRADWSANIRYDATFQLGPKMNINTVVSSSIFRNVFFKKWETDLCHQNLKTKRSLHQLKESRFCIQSHLGTIPLESVFGKGQQKSRDHSRQRKMDANRLRRHVVIVAELSAVQKSESVFRVLISWLNFLELFQRCPGRLEKDFTVRGAPLNN